MKDVFCIFLILLIKINTTFAQTWKDLFNEGINFYQQSNYAESIVIFEKAVPQAEKEFGKKHYNYVVSCMQLAALYEIQGRYNKAEQLLRSVWNIYNRYLDKNTLDYVSVCNNLARLYKENGIYNDLELFCKEALNVSKKLLGKENSIYANACHNLAEFYRVRGLYKEAEAFYKESMEIFSKTVGKNHRDYANVCSNLAFLYVLQGFYSKAELLQKEALNIYLSLGEKHPDFAEAYNNLGIIYKKIGLYSKSEDLFIKAINIITETFQKKHRRYIRYADNLSKLYLLQKRYREAEIVLQEILIISIELLGDEHPDNSEYYKDLAIAYQSQGKYDEAEFLFKKALDIQVKTAGRKHPNYGVLCGSIAAFYKEKGDYIQAENLFKEAYNILAQTLGKEHPDYAKICENLAEFFEQKGFWDKAENLYREASNALISNMQHNFKGLSEREKLEFVSILRRSFEKYYSFVLRTKKTEATTWILENEFITKGLIFYTMLQLKRNVMETHNQGMLNFYHKWRSVQQELSNIYVINEEANNDLYEKENEANEFEKILTLALIDENSSSTNLFPKKRKLTEIKLKIQKDEALIDITRIKYYDRSNCTDSILYIALVLKKESEFPEMIVFPNGKRMEERKILATIVISLNFAKRILYLMEFFSNP